MKKAIAMVMTVLLGIAAMCMSGCEETEKKAEKIHIGMAIFCEVRENGHKIEDKLFCDLTEEDYKKEIEIPYDQKSRTLYAKGRYPDGSIREHFIRVGIERFINVNGEEEDAWSITSMFRKGTYYWEFDIDYLDETAFFYSGQVIVKII